jgi:hypothetical protein
MKKLANIAIILVFVCIFYPFVVIIIGIAFAPLFGPRFFVMGELVKQIGEFRRNRVALPAPWIENA